MQEGEFTFSIWYIRIGVSDPYYLDRLIGRIASCINLCIYPQSDTASPMRQFPAGRMPPVHGHLYYRRRVIAGSHECFGGRKEVPTFLIRANQRSQSCRS